MYCSQVFSLMCIPSTPMPPPPGHGDVPRTHTQLLQEFCVFRIALQHLQQICGFHSLQLDIPVDVDLLIETDVYQTRAIAASLAGVKTYRHEGRGQLLLKDQQTHPERSGKQLRGQRWNFRKRIGAGDLEWGGVHQVKRRGTKFLSSLYHTSGVLFHVTLTFHHIY